MPQNLERFQHTGHSHFITFSCYHHQPLLESETNRYTFEAALERVRRGFELCVFGYVVMPDHVHLLVSEPVRQNLADALKSLKQGVSRLLIGEADHFWQKRYYDFNVLTNAKFQEKLRYIHRNPVRRRFCERPEDWIWSSFRHYASGIDGRVQIESQWAVRGRKHTEAEIPS